MPPNDADGMANSVDSDQTAPLFAQACVSESLASLWYISYRKFPKYSDTQKICCNDSKI